jgi:hypothetical protein
MQDTLHAQQAPTNCSVLRHLTSFVDLRAGCFLLPVMASAMAGRLAAMRHGLAKAAAGASIKLVDSLPREIVDDIFSCALKKQTGVTLR